MWFPGIGQISSSSPEIVQIDSPAQAYSDSIVHRAAAKGEGSSRVSHQGPRDRAEASLMIRFLGWTEHKNVPNPLYLPVSTLFKIHLQLVPPKERVEFSTP